MTVGSLANADILEFSLEGTPILPFGGEILLASTPRGQIVGAEIEMTFTTAGDFQAEHFVFEMVGPTGGVQYIGGTDLGWSGQGTFSASLTSDNFNGLLEPAPGASLVFWFMNVSPTLQSLPTPIQGSFGEGSAVRFDMIGCANMNDDTVVTVVDLLLYLQLWFAGDIFADRTSDSVVDVVDLLEYLEGFFAGSCNCGGC